MTDQRLNQIRFTAHGILDGKEWRIQPQDALDLIGELERVRGLCNRMQDERAQMVDLLLDARVFEGRLVDGRPVENLDEHWAGIEAVLAR
ncbi:MAG TPA: hypothetical protein VF112_09760 [Candidatus Dormibacteraeota bacterium]